MSERSRVFFFAKRPHCKKRALASKYLFYTQILIVLDSTSLRSCVVLEAQVFR